jgi:glycosyltransferase domain-containing protein
MSTSPVSFQDATKCTLIILVHYRQWTLPRITEYYADFPGDIIITDSSAEPAPPDFIRAPRARYIHSKDAFYFRKIRDALEMTKTPYAAVCADDDFIVKNTLAKAARILDAEPALSCVRGRTIRFDGPTVQTALEEEWARHAKNVLFNTAERGRAWQAIGMMRWAVCMDYAVYRKEALIEAYDLMLANEHLQPIFFWDYEMRYLAACAGGIRFIPEPMSVRDDTHVLDTPTTVPLDGWKIDVRYQQLPQRLREIGDPLAARLASRIGVSDVKRVEAFNQKLFSNRFSSERWSERCNHAPPWLYNRQPVKLSVADQRDVDQIMAIVARHRSPRDRVFGTIRRIRRRLRLGRFIGPVFKVARHLRQLVAGPRPVPGG